MENDMNPYPELLSYDEQKSLYEYAKDFYQKMIEHDFFLCPHKANWPIAFMNQFILVIEKYGNRDAGRKWSRYDLENHPDHGKTPKARTMLNPDMPTQELRLHMGELNADEVLVARAAIAWANSRMDTREDEKHNH